MKMSSSNYYPPGQLIYSCPKSIGPSIIRIPNIDNYTQEIIHGNLVLTPKDNRENDLLKIVQFTDSSTVECVIKEEGEKKIKTIFLDVWKLPETQFVLKLH